MESTQFRECHHLCADYSKTFLIDICFSVVLCSENGAFSWWLAPLSLDFLRHWPCSSKAWGTSPDQVKSRWTFYTPLNLPLGQSIDYSSAGCAPAKPVSASSMVSYCIRFLRDVNPRLSSFSALLDLSVTFRLTVPPGGLLFFVG